MSFNVIMGLPSNKIGWKDKNTAGQEASLHLSPVEKKSASLNSSLSTFVTATTACESQIISRL